MASALCPWALAISLGTLSLPLGVQAAPGSVVLDPPPPLRAPPGDPLGDDALVSLRRRFAQALQHRLSGRLSEAQTQFEALLPAYPLMVSPIRRHLSLIHAARGRYGESLSLAEDLLVGEGVRLDDLTGAGGGPGLYFGSEIAWGLVLRAEALLRLQRPREALGTIEPSLRLSGRGMPALSRRYLAKGRALEALGEGAQAYEAYLRAREGDPKGAFGRLAGQALKALPARVGQDLGGVEEAVILDAIEDTLNAGKHRQALAMGKRARGQVRSSEGRRTLDYLIRRAEAAGLPIDDGTRALEALSEAPNLRVEQYWSIVEALSDLRRQARDYDGQITILERFLNTFPQGQLSANGRMELADLYADRGRIAEAEALYAEVARLFPADPQADDARWFLAWSRFEKGDTAGAFLHLRAHAQTVVPGSRADARALYWLARAAEAEGRLGLAWWLYADVTRRFPNNYYGAMAAWRSKGGIPQSHQKAPLGTPPRRVPIIRESPLADGGSLEVDAPPWKIARELLFPGFLNLLGGVKDGAAARSLARAMELSLGGMMAGAYTALSDARSNPRAGAQGQLILAAFYHSLGQVQRGMRIAQGHLSRAQARSLFGPRGRPEALAYPVPFLDFFLREGFRQGVEPAVLLGMAQQESGFWPTAKSSADARGLLQLIPRTARAMARSEGMAFPAMAELYRPSTNVRLGAAYLRDMLDHFGGNLPRALAAYNAGPGAVERWLRRLGAEVEDDVFIEEIPYHETREYVRIVLRNARGYWETYPTITINDALIEDAKGLPRYQQPPPQGPRAPKAAPKVEPKVSSGERAAPAKAEADPEALGDKDPTPSPIDPDEPGGFVGPGGFIDWD